MISMGQQVNEIMTRDCQCIDEHATIKEAAYRLADLQVGFLPICGDDQKLKGTITDRDIVVKVLAADLDPADTQANEIAEGKPITVQSDQSVDEAIQIMSENCIRRIPVIEDHKLVGVISQGDIAKWTDEAKTGNLVADISQAPDNSTLGVHA